ncbi:hypothetical protein MesoLjLc_51630 [Mesorhizobium sp. L-8-10]|nr:hypothetical protein MesoLjLc_51630 [Mesorhizobium sp. L-8-10]
MGSYTPGYRQIKILRSVVGDGWFRAEQAGDYRACLLLHDRGMLARDKKDARRFTPTETGSAWIAAHDGRLA